LTKYFQKSNKATTSSKATSKASN